MRIITADILPQKDERRHLVVPVPIKRITGVDQLSEAVTLYLVGHQLPAQAHAQTAAEAPRRDHIQLEADQLPG